MIYVMLANGFEETEAIAVIDILRRAELDVTTVGIGDNFIMGAHNIPIVADTTDVAFNRIPEDAEMLVLPGGMPGTLNLERSKFVQGFIDYMIENDRYIAAICAAPSILGHRNLLENKKASCYVGFEQELFGAEVSTDSVSVDGKIITSRSAGTVFDFSLELVRILTTEKLSDKIGAAILWK